MSSAPWKPPTAPGTGSARLRNRLALGLAAGVLLAGASARWPALPPPAGPVFEGYPLVGKVFVIDPGHGGIDSGCHGQGWMEKDVTLAVALELTRLLRLAGALTGITRNQDMELGHMLPAGGSRYRRDLTMRALVARRLDPELVISLHANASTNPSHNGAMVFYGPGRADSRRAATLILDELKTVVPGNQNAVLPANLYILREVPYPAVLVELGFLTHRKDREILLSREGSSSVARAMFRAIVRLFEQEPGPDLPPPREGADGENLPAASVPPGGDPALCPGHGEPA